MKLKTKIKDLDKKELVYIGSKSGFIFIGYPEDFEKEVDELNTKHLKNFKTTLYNVGSRYNTLYNNKPNEGKHEIIKVWSNGRCVEKEVDYAFLIKRWKDKLNQLEETKSRYEEMVDTFRDFRERDVLDCYRNIDNNGTILIVSGNECGRFWFYSDVLKSKKGIKIESDIEEDEEYDYE